MACAEDVGPNPMARVRARGTIGTGSSDLTVDSGGNEGWDKAQQALTAEDAEDAEEKCEEYRNGWFCRMQAIDVSLTHRSCASQELGQRIPVRFPSASSASSAVSVLLRLANRDNPDPESRRN